MTPEHIAQICHEANRRYCSTIGDLSHKPWEETTWALKQSAIAGVVWVQENPAAPLNALHENWRRAKEIDGWVFGKTKSEDDKTHPCLLPYEKLPPEQQVKDRLFRAITLALTDGETNAA